jgi:predicted DNA-binding transcriptional regulator YafY
VYGKEVTVLDAVERRDRLIQLLLLRGRTSVKNLAQELEVSERTILRDVQLLSHSKPISASPGRGGGVFISDYHNMKRFYMKEYEIRLLQKIISESEQNRMCILSTQEMQLLKDIVTFYSENQL